MKLLHGINLSTPGGVENLFYRFLQTAKSKNDLPLSVDVVTWSKIDEKYEPDIHSLANVYQAKYWKNFIKIPRPLRPFFNGRQLNTCQSDTLVMVNDFSPEWLRRTLYKLPCTRIFYDHGRSWDEAPREAITAFDHFITVSRAGQKHLEHNWELSKKDITVLPNPLPPFESISKEKQKRLERRIYDQSHIETRKPTVMFLGRFVPQKGVASLIRAARYLEDECEIILVGDGPDRKRLLALQDKLDLNNLTFTGFQRAPIPFFAAADVVVIPSLWDPCPLVTFEAAHLRIPLLVSAVDGLAEIVPSSEYGFPLKPTKPLEDTMYDPDSTPDRVVDQDGKLVPPRALDPERLAERVRKVLNDPELASQRADRLYELLSERPTTKEYTEGYLNILSREGTQSKPKI